MATTFHGFYHHEHSPHQNRALNFVPYTALVGNTNAEWERPFQYFQLSPETLSHKATSYRAKIRIA
jgi:hypothetical protein